MKLPHVFCVLSPLKPILLAFYCILPLCHSIVSLKWVKCSHPLVNIVKSEEAWSIQKVPLFTTEAISLWNNSIYPLFYFYTLHLLLSFFVIPSHIIITIALSCPAVVFYVYIEYFETLAISTWCCQHLYLINCWLRMVSIKLFQFFAFFIFTPCLRDYVAIFNDKGYP